MQRRYGVKLDPTAQVLPVNGSREALFAFAQSVVDAGAGNATVICPNPFYQIYEGAALLAGAKPYYAPAIRLETSTSTGTASATPCGPATQLVYVCSPGNPTGAVMPMADWEKLFELSGRYGFVIASDECYSEIYFRDDLPRRSGSGRQVGRADFRNLVVFTSLSKRSNVPGMRSGFVAGDANILKQFLLYRTYHGCAMSGMVQAASIAAWNDEAHVVANRDLYRKNSPKSRRCWPRSWMSVCPTRASTLGGRAGRRRRRLRAGLAGSIQCDRLAGKLSGSPARADNPGAGRIRMALVAETEECIEAARRIVAFVKAQLDRDETTT